MTDTLDTMLAFDPLAEAEKMTGASYKEDEETLRAGMALHLLHNGFKKQALQAAGDTYWGITPADALSAMEAAGFVLVHSEPVGDTGDVQRILVHPDGLLIDFDSYYADTTINSGSVYYQWRPAVDGPDRWEFTASGGFSRTDESVWIGYHDIREGLFRKIQRLRENGEFVSPWIDTDGWARPRISTYLDWRHNPSFNIEANTERILAGLPTWAQKVLGR